MFKNIFMLTFSHNEDIKKIFEIKIILGIKVEIEAIKSSRLIPQCKRCQSYGHTQKYCRREPRCVKCTERHLTQQCEKPKNSEAKCVLCEEKHPANYRGCKIAKQMPKIKAKNTKKVVLPQQPKRQGYEEDKQNVVQRQATRDSKLYSQATLSKIRLRESTKNER